LKFFSFKILILCILLPPVLYIVSVLSIERHLKSRYAEEIEDVYMGDTQPLFSGDVTLKDAINKNIDQYLQSKIMILWGVKANITVTTKHNTILYPEVFDDEEDSLLQPDPMQVAADNFKLMNEGLVINVDLKLEHNTFLSNVLLAFYICISVLVLYIYYKAGIKKAMQEDTEKSREVARLQELEENNTETLKALIQDKKNLKSEITKTRKSLKKERIKASINEDEMIKEIIALEEKFDKNIALQQEKQEEIDALKEKIKLFEKERRKDIKQKTKLFDSSRKRFKALYKNVTINERAINGFVDLTDDMKIKGEEIIHKLNNDPNVVPIKRKVFSKKRRTTVQEIIFSYKGRLYYRKTKDNKIEILTIGTKNTQAKDLEFLDSI